MTSLIYMLVLILLSGTYWLACLVCLRCVSPLLMRRLERVLPFLSLFTNWKCEKNVSGYLEYFILFEDASFLFYFTHFNDDHIKCIVKNSFKLENQNFCFKIVERKLFTILRLDSFLQKTLHSVSRNQHFLRKRTVCKIFLNSSILNVFLC